MVDDQLRGSGESSANLLATLQVVVAENRYSAQLPRRTPSNEGFSGFLAGYALMRSRSPAGGFTEVDVVYIDANGNVQAGRSRSVRRRRRSLRKYAVPLERRYDDGSTTLADRRVCHSRIGPMFTTTATTEFVRDSTTWSTLTPETHHGGVRSCKASGLAPRRLSRSRRSILDVDRANVRVTCETTGQVLAATSSWTARTRPDHRHSARPERF